MALTERCFALALALLVGAGVGAGEWTGPKGPAQGGAAGHRAHAEPAAEGAIREFIVDSQASELRIVVLPAGLFARMGHPHVIGGPVLDGRVLLADPVTRSEVELSIEVARFELDRPEWLEAEGFDPDMDEEDIADTRRNMLGEDVLDADTYPEVRIRSTDISGSESEAEVTVKIRLRGRARELTVPVELELEADCLIATGRFELVQSEFGIRPFSAAAGLLRVADELDVRFRIVGRTGD